MAVLTNEEKARIGRRFSDQHGGVGRRSDLYAAIQAIEDWFEDGRAALSGKIDDAVSVVVTYTNPQKKTLVKHWLNEKFRRGG